MIGSEGISKLDCPMTCCSVPTNNNLNYIYGPKQCYNVGFFPIHTNFRPTEFPRKMGVFGEKHIHISVNPFDCVFLGWRKGKVELEGRGQVRVLNRGVTLVVCTRLGTRSVVMRTQTYSQGWVTYVGLGQESNLSIYNGSEKEVGVKLRGDFHLIENPFEMDSS